jgi:hypothetical protein
VEKAQWLEHIEPIRDSAKGGKCRFVLYGLCFVIARDNHNQHTHIIREVGCIAEKEEIGGARVLLIYYSKFNIAFSNSLLQINTLRCLQY